MGELAATLPLQTPTPACAGDHTPPAATTTPPNLNVTFTYDGSTSAPAAAGSYQVVAQIDDLSYAGSTTGTLIINKAPQPILFPTPPDPPLPQPPTLPTIRRPACPPAPSPLSLAPATPHSHQSHPLPNTPPRRPPPPPPALPPPPPPLPPPPLTP